MWGEAVIYASITAVHYFYLQGSQPPAECRRGINENGDFCYVILDTLVFYLYHRRPLVEYAPTSVGTAMEVKRDCGHALVFSFVCGDGTPERFGNDSAIFCN